MTDVSLTAYYEGVTDSVNVTFNGSVSAQATAGETVTLKVTKPDTTVDTLTTTTLADRTYTLSKIYTVAGNYSVIASVPADATYKAATSASVAFTINLLDRTITVTVTQA